MRVRFTVPALLLALLTAAPAASQPADALFDPSVLHRIDLRVHSRDWDELRVNYRDNRYYPADLVWRGEVARNVGIRSRGSGSRSGIKPGLRVDVNRYAAGQTFLGLTSLVLDNLTQDASGIRERLTMRTYQLLGVAAPREAHAALYVNGTFAGLYAIVEAMDKQALRRMFDRGDGHLEDDGYLFEYEWVRPYYFEYLGPDFDRYAELLSPRTHEHALMHALYEPVEAMVRVVAEAPDAALAAALSEYLDIPAFLRYLAVQAVLAEWDGFTGYAGMNNFYFYRFERTRQSVVIPWDADTAFSDVAYPLLQGFEENRLVARLMRLPRERALFLAAIAETVAALTAADPDTGLPWLEQEIRTCHEQIAAAMRADERKPFTNEEFEADIERLLDFSARRPAIVWRELATR